MTQNKSVEEVAQKIYWKVKEYQRLSEPDTESLLCVEQIGKILSEERQTSHTSQNKSVEEVVERKGFFTFRFHYSDRDGNRLYQVSHLNDDMYFDDAYSMAKRFIKEYPQSCMVWFERNRRVEELLQQERQTSQEREREIVENHKKVLSNVLAILNDGFPMTAIKALEQEITNPNKD